MQKGSGSSNIVANKDLKQAKLPSSVAFQKIKYSDHTFDTTSKIGFWRIFVAYAASNARQRL